MDDFDNVSWNNEAPASPDHRQPAQRRESHGQDTRSAVQDEDEVMQAGQDADAVDLAGIGQGTLQCTVSEPLKEGDGTKDAYISYLVTTKVSCAERVRLRAKLMMVYRRT